MFFNFYRILSFSRNSSNEAVRRRPGRFRAVDDFPVSPDEPRMATLMYRLFNLLANVVKRFGLRLAEIS